MQLPAIFIDRRELNQERNISNRQRFMQRVRSQLLDSIKNIDEVSVSDIQNTKKVVKIRKSDVEEPTFTFARAGKWDIVVSGNDRNEVNTAWVAGDEIPKPPGKRRGPGGVGNEDSEDSFLFEMNKDEFLDLFFDDLELPNLKNNVIAKTDVITWQRQGFTTAGSPASFDLRRTMKLSIGRRVSLNRPKIELVENLLDKEEDGLTEEEQALVSKFKRISYIDPLDQRYRNYEQVPNPTFQAVCFLLMDVSGSMDEYLKDLAKRYFLLLVLFLQRTYPTVDVVFIRHTHYAEEVNEDVFFNDPKSGGTLVLSVLEKVYEIILKRYPTDQWNIYIAQASDGDCGERDGEQSVSFINSKLLPISQFMSYLNVGSPEYKRQTTALLEYYGNIHNEKFAMAKVSHKKEIFPIFRKLFEKRA